MLTSHSLLTCDGFPSHAPITVCENLTPFHRTPSMQPISSQPLNTSPYSIHVSSENYTRDAMITVTVNGTKAIKVIKLDVRTLDFDKISVLNTYSGRQKNHANPGQIKQFFPICRGSSSKPVLWGMPDQLAPFRGLCLRTKPSCGAPVEKNRYP